MEKLKDSANIYGPMDKFIRVNGLIIQNMVLECGEAHNSIEQSKFGKFDGYDVQMEIVKSLQSTIQDLFKNAQGTKKFTNGDIYAMQDMVCIIGKMTTFSKEMQKMDLDTEMVYGNAQLKDLINIKENMQMIKM